MDSLSIFIVEDEIITARSIAKNIKKFGYQLAGIATSGPEAILKILNTRPDLVLIDICLEPNGVDGITVAKKIQSHLEIPIIYLTAHSDRGTLERAKITTPFGYILKPYSSKDLQISIELALHKHQQDMQVMKREKVLATYFDRSQDGVLATDEKDRIIYMNPMAEKLTQSNFSLVENDHTAEVVPLIDEETAKISEPIQEVLEKGKVIYLEDSAILITRSDTTSQVNPSTSTPIEQNKQEQDKKSIEPGAILLLTKSKINPNSNIAGDRLLKDLSTYLVDLIQQELRTPLTVILSTAESLETYRQKWTVSKQDQGLRGIQQAVGQIKGLLDNVAIWTELEQGKVTLNPSWVNLTAFSQDIIDNLRFIDRERHQLTLSNQEDSRMVFLDKKIVHYIIANLLLNSLKYSPQNTTVSLSWEFRSNLVLIKVSDRGIGIPSKDHKQIFEPFYRASNASHLKGTGLGLVVVKACVELCGGEISLSSQANSETIFTVSLPLNNS